MTDTSTLRWIDGQQVHRLLDYRRLVQALREAHLQPMPISEDVCMSEPGAMRGNNFLLLPAWSGQRMMGVKLLSVFPDNVHADVPLPTVQGIYAAFDGRTGTPLFMADGAALTLRKTAADSALGLDLLAPASVSTLLMIGAGDMAGPLIEAFTQVRPSLTKVLLWNRTLPRAEALAIRLKAAGIDSQVVPDLDEALPLADVVCSATMSQQPLIKGALLKAGAHVNLVGSWQEDMREADDAAIERAQIYVDSREVSRHSGELLQPINSGLISWADIRADLFELCQGYQVPALEPGQVTVFKNAGGAHLDLFTAQFLASEMAGNGEKP
jgi:ornithine cyclodeaminase